MPQEHAPFVLKVAKDHYFNGWSTDGTPNIVHQCDQAVSWVIFENAESTMLALIRQGFWCKVEYL